MEFIEEVSIFVLLNSDVESLFEYSYINIVSNFKDVKRPVNSNSTLSSGLAGI